jgi:spore coat protein H
MKMNLAIFLCLGMLLTTPSVIAQTSSETPTNAPGDHLFEAPTKVVSFHLTLSEAQFAALSPKGQPGFGPPGFGPPGFGQPPEPTENTHRNTFGVEFPWSQGELTVDGTTLKDVGVRYKGNYTFMATAQALKKSMKIDFNRFVDGQKFDGLTMLNLHCGVSDPFLTREALSCVFFRDSGVPVARTVFAELTLTVPGKYDNEFVGIYTLTEQVNKAFLKRHFGDSSGLLLKPEGLQGGPTYMDTKWKIYEQRFRPENSASDKQKQRLIDFTFLISKASDADFEAQIGDYLYLNPTSNEFVFIPWDLDLSLATWPAVGTPEQLVKLSIRHPHSGENKLLDRILAIEKYNQQYLGIVKELHESNFSSGRQLAMLEKLQEALVEPRAKEKSAIGGRREGRSGNGPGTMFGGGQFGQSMPPKRFLELRSQSVADQLEGKAEGFVPQPFGFGFGPR